MMNAEIPLSQIVEEDQQNLRFRGNVRRWVHDEISYAELMQEYPYIPSDGFPWVMQQFRHFLERFCKDTPTESA
jgi:hypothetical protein